VSPFCSAAVSQGRRRIEEREKREGIVAGAEFIFL
jgi:hypothetical protein